MRLPMDEEAAARLGAEAARARIEREKAEAAYWRAFNETYDKRPKTWRDWPIFQPPAW